MGYSLKLAEAACINTKNKGAAFALDWIEQHKDEPLPDTNTTTPMVVETTNVVPNVAEIKPIEPEKRDPNAKPTREDLVVSRYGKTAEERRAHEEKERLLDIEKLKREKAAAAREKERILRQLDEDKKARAGLTTKATQPAPVTTPVTAIPNKPPTTTATPPTKTFTDALIQFRMPDGSTQKETFKATDTIATVHAWVAYKLHGDNFNLLIPMPRREFTEVDFDLTLAQIDLVPRGSLTVMKTAQKGIVKKGEEYPVDISHGVGRGRGRGRGFSYPGYAPVNPMVDPMIQEGDEDSDYEDVHNPDALPDENMSYEQLLDLEEKIGKVNPGLNPEIVKNLPVINYQSTTTEKQMCLVCREEYKTNDPVKILSCTHIYHKGCIDKWFEDHKTCPVCNLRIS